MKCLIDMGDSDLFFGSHSLFTRSSGIGSGPAGHSRGPEALEKMKEALFPGRFSIPSIVNTYSPDIVRVHETRVELNPGRDTAAQNAAMAYIRENPAITDVILHVPEDGKSTLTNQVGRICPIVEQLGGVEHVACIRLRWQAFQTRPDLFTPGIIDEIARWARFSIGDPLKIEMETWWLLPRDLLLEHGRLAGLFLCRGVQTYANLALVSGVNDDPEIISAMAHGLREAGIHFHHVYTAGLFVQNFFNRAYPIETDQVLAIASHVRKVCSGREIPLYMIQTPLGEVDFGLTSCLVRPWNTQQENTKEKWFLQLDPYDISCFTAMDPGFSLAKTGARDVNGLLMVPIFGLVRSGNFPL